jgi:hypothetical protein
MRRQGVHADRDRDRGPASGDLLEDLQVDLVGLAAAAPLLGLRQAEQPRGPELREHPFGIGFGLLVGIDDGIEHLVGDVAGEVDEVFCLLRWQQPVDRHVRAFLSNLVSTVSPPTASTSAVTSGSG